LIVSAPEDPEILDYAPPSPPLQRRDSLEYYREPPVMANWTWRHLVGYVVAYVAVGFALLYALGRWLASKGI
jgi:hypothetical protein